MRKHCWKSFAWGALTGSLWCGLAILALVHGCDAQAQQPGYRWHLSPSGKQWNLSDGSRWVGAFVLDEQRYYRLDGNQYVDGTAPCGLPDGAAQKPMPAAPKECNCCQGCKCGKACACKLGAKRCSPDCKCGALEARAEMPLGGVPNFGVNESKLGEGPAYILNGRKSTRDEVIDRLMGEGKIPDDSQLPRITIIGSEADRKKVRDDLKSHPALAPFRGKFVTKDYAPDAWEVSCGFFAGGAPSIYVQTPGGKNLHRQDDYRDGAEGLAMALRKVDPSYQPAKDPDLRKSPDITSIATATPTIALAGVSGLVWIFGRLRGKKV